ncbi:hypothetical protein AVEN_196442-1 [Araneus ventricosus]|uniref:Uncharacterized protein n=1 Tax=Araneus ventricosus TaxID=182803 RepID=A0A4Y2AWG6_ARAVE|nr:hypothetical protein AVEN_196442-1 [Araneus ventricosus]
MECNILLRTSSGKNNSTSKLMENEALFTNVPENKKHRKQEKQLLYKLETKTDSKSVIITVTSVSITLGAYQLTSSHCGQDSKEIQRHSKDTETSQHLRVFIPFPTG